jgi:hypothetical protein
MKTGTSNYHNDEDRDTDTNYHNDEDRDTDTNYHNDEDRDTDTNWLEGGCSHLMKVTIFPVASEVISPEMDLIIITVYLIHCCVEKDTFPIHLPRVYSALHMLRNVVVVGNNRLSELSVSFS